MLMADARTAILTAEFVALTTYRLDGRAVTTPVWAAAEDGRLVRREGVVVAQLLAAPDAPRRVEEDAARAAGGQRVDGVQRGLARVVDVARARAQQRRVDDAAGAGLGHAEHVVREPDALVGALAPLALAVAHELARVLAHDLVRAHVREREDARAVDA